MIENRDQLPRARRRRRGDSKLPSKVTAVSFLLFLVLLPPPTASFSARSRCSTTRKSRCRCRLVFPDSGERQSLCDSKENGSSSTINRRGALTSMASLAVLLPTVAQAKNDPLESIAVGNGVWNSIDRSPMSSFDQSASTTFYSPSFCTYAARLLIRYDEGVSTWWNNLEASLQLVAPQQRQQKLGRSFGSLAKSLQQGLSGSSPTEVYDMFLTNYGTMPDAARQIALLFALLPSDQQPVERLEEYYSKASVSSNRKPILSKKITESITATTLFGDNLTRLLPPIFRISRTVERSSFTIEPVLNLYEVGIGEEFGQTAVATAFGPLASVPLIREVPNYSPSTYALFGLAGATGCALTHTVVIPLDVVKTRAQTDATASQGKGGMLAAGRKIVETEGVNGLLLGAQATIAGYSWYGLSVYPSYTFFKRFLAMNVYPIDYAVAHANQIALIAGALAAVVASLGLTPLEAARIRVVAEPNTYRPLGLTGTIGVISKEDATLGWTNLYAGLPSLLTRQVIFGSVKFLAFERACDLIYSQFPTLRDTTWTALAVSLVAGGMSGVLSSVVSQPADSVLTFVAKGDKDGGSLGLLDGARQMIEKEGPGSLFRGLGSRCIWAGAIIGGQFLLYDVFRTLFGVNANDLSQIYQVSFPQ